MRADQFVVFCAVAVAACAGLAQAQWSTVLLNPTTASGSKAFGGSGSSQVGYATVNSFAHASVWNSSANTWVDLRPNFGSDSYALAAYGTQQTGYVRVGGSDQAVVWNGTAASYRILHPGGAFYSRANATNGSIQAGYATFPIPTGNRTHAGYWRGTSTSWVDLHPSNPIATESFVNAISGTQFAGATKFSQVTHASIWNESAAGWFDIHPFTASDSQLLGTDGTQQVGQSRPFGFGGNNHASLWSGTRDSYVDLNPDGYSESFAYSVAGGYQVGSVSQGGGTVRASIWNGSAATWEDLSLALPSGFSDSFAQSIAIENGIIYVSGYATYFSQTQGRLVSEAVLWTRPVPAPGSLLAVGLAGAWWARRRRG